jgi:vacuolar-type H+-ATPase subunit E/Vma4
MGLEGVLGVLDRDCTVRLRAIEEKAEAEAEAILHAARTEADRIRQAAAKDLAGPAERDRRAALHEAQLCAIRIRDDARTAVLHSVLDRVRAALADARRAPGYPALLAHLIGQALGDLAGSLAAGEVPRLSFDVRDRSLVEAISKTCDPVPELQDDLESWGGAAAQSRDRRVIVDNTLEARLEQAWPALRSDLVRRLEAG